MAINIVNNFVRASTKLSLCGGSLECRDEGATKNKSVMHKEELDQCKRVHQGGLGVCLDRGKAQKGTSLSEAATQ